MKLDLLNYQSIDSINKDASKPLREKNFDKIMIDAPCSALGTISKNPDKKYKFDLTEINNYSQIQLEILNNGFKHLKKGGELIYVVCTFTKEETTNVIDEFLKQNNDAKEVEFTTFDNKFTGKRLNTEMFYDGDIFFIAKIKKE
jgi:16S rRNA (cytosine967-C5)-methyltransferase